MSKLWPGLQKDIPKGKEDFEIAINEFRVQQAAQDFLFFWGITDPNVSISVLMAASMS
jgi:hypothetical protein